MSTRKEQYEKKREELSKICVRCRNQNQTFPPTADRCDSCRTGKKLRWLETEYSDITGFSHKTWQ